MTENTYVQFNEKTRIEWRWSPPRRRTVLAYPDDFGKPSCKTTQATKSMEWPGQAFGVIMPRRGRTRVLGLLVATSAEPVTREVKRRIEWVPGAI